MSSHRDKFMIFRRFASSGLRFLAAVLVLLCPTLSAVAQETDTISQALNFAAAEALHVAGLSAHLNIETGSEPGIRLNLTGSKRQIESIRTEATADGLLIIKGTSPATSSTFNITNGSSTVIVSHGGTASVTIGGNGQSTVIMTDSEPPLQITIRLNPTTPISISGFSGSATLAALQAPLELELISGKAELAAVSDANLSIAGSGHIALERATGKLILNLRGSGDIVVDQADLSALEVTILGAGNVRVGGQAKQAALALNGAGNIYVETVKQKPQRRVLGVGEIRIGNW